jgi:hypothetical protein
MTACLCSLFIMHCRDETKLIQEIVSDIQKKLSHELSLSLDAEGVGNSDRECTDNCSNGGIAH